MDDQEQHRMLGAALWYAAHEWHVFPCQPLGKAPLTPHGYKDATTDADQIRAWWAQWPDANVAIATGESGLVVVDADVKNGARGLESWRDLRADLHLVDDTACAETPSDGLHVYYGANGHTVRCSAGTLGEGLDVRAQGGYVVAPPSRTEVGDYSWALGYRPDEREILSLPARLADALAGRPASQRAAPSAAEDKIAEGQRNGKLASLAGAMRRRGMSPEAIDAALLAENAARCDPPLPEGEVHEIAASVARYVPKQVDGVRDVKYPKSEEYVQVLAALGYTFRMNECNDRVEVGDDLLSDALVAKINTELRDLGYPRVNVARDAYTAHALDNSYHPIQEYLKGLRWDGGNHISTLAAYFTDRHDMLPLYLRRWLVGACAKAFAAEQNRMLVLDGRQNLGKSHFVRWLVPGDLGLEYLVEGPIRPDDKDDLLRLISAWIWEVAELGSTTRRADREALKHFVTRRQVTVRAPYGRIDLIKPALASFVGTVNNESGLLSDPTGHRRFMIANVTEIGWKYATEVDVQQVWAQAYNLYRAGEPWELTPEEAEQAEVINEEYEVADVLEDYFHQGFVLTGNAEDFMQTTEVLFHLHGVGWAGEGTQRLGAMAVSRLMTKLGLGKVRRYKDGKQERGYTGLKVRPIDLPT